MLSGTKCADTGFQERETTADSNFKCGPKNNSVSIGSNLNVRSPGKKCHDEDASIHRDFFSVASDFFPPRGDLTFRLEPIETELFSGPHLK